VTTAPGKLSKISANVFILLLSLFGKTGKYPPMKQLTSSDLSEFFLLQGRQYYALWQCQPPGASQTSSASAESDCDTWSLVFARWPMQTFDAPPEFRPWILARLISAGVETKMIAARADTPYPPVPFAQMIEHWLVVEWREVLRPRWRELDCNWFPL
jgi:hypothetical protein